MTLTQMAVDVLTTSDPHLKILKSEEYSKIWFSSDKFNKNIDI